MMKRTYRPIALAALLLLTMTGCQQQTESIAETTATTQTTAQTTTTPEPTQATDITTMPPPAPEECNGINPLTGESGYPDRAVGMRPVAVMVNNIPASYPQYGIAQADVLYELPVEGGVTRMMAVYADFTAVPDVCSVRSARYYYPKLAMGMDAVYLHWGTEQVHAVETMAQLGIDHLDGGKLERSALFYRDPERVGRYAVEHTGFLRGAELPAVLEQRVIRRETDRGMQFSFYDTPTAAGDPCTRAAISFSNSSMTGFTFHAESQMYLVDHNGKPQMDARANAQLSFRNVLILQTDVSYLDEAEYLRKIELTAGEGYCVSLGSYQPIRWEKPDDSAPFAFYTADGSPLQLNTGSTYIGIVGQERRLTLASE